MRQADKSCKPVCGQRGHAETEGWLPMKSQNLERGSSCNRGRVPVTVTQTSLGHIVSRCKERLIEQERELTWLTFCGNNWKLKPPSFGVHDRILETWSRGGFGWNGTKSNEYSSTTVWPPTSSQRLTVSGRFTGHNNLWSLLLSVLWHKTRQRPCTLTRGFSPVTEGSMWRDSPPYYLSSLDLKTYVSDAEMLECTCFDLHKQIILSSAVHLEIKWQ